jgi:hypothetical protein
VCVCVCVYFLFPIFSLFHNSFFFLALTLDDFNTTKKRMIADLDKAKESTNTRANICLSQILYPANHTHYKFSVEESIAQIEVFVYVCLCSFFCFCLFARLCLLFICLSQICTQQITHIINFLWKNSQIKVCICVFVYVCLCLFILFMFVYPILYSTKHTD